MTPQYYIGIDVSKATLDCTLLKKGSLLANQKVENTPEGIKCWLRTLKKEQGAGGAGTLFCFENTGSYKEPLLQVLGKKRGIQLCVESGFRIKRSLGIQRGKNDQIDSSRIAQYAYKHRTTLHLYKATRPIIQELKTLNALKRRLEINLQQLHLHVREKELYIKQKRKMSLTRRCKGSMEALKEDHLALSEEILELLLSDTYLARLYEILTSAPGIGKVVAIELILATNEFKNFATWKQFACYCGTAPFEHTSGTSVQGKTRVSKIADRHMKAVLHMPALSAIRMCGSYKDYFDKKVKEGKPKMSVLNMIKNRMIRRLFACVQRDELYKEPSTQAT